MSNLKRWIRDLLGFSSMETNAFIILLPLIAVIIFTQPVYHRFFNSRKTDFKKDKHTLDSLVAQWEHQQKDLPAISKGKSTERKAFPFDPNKATQKELLTLGFNAQLVNRIIHYREKGGVFKIKSHLLKIYGMDSTLYTALYPSILLPEKIEKQHSDRTILEKKVFTFAKFNLNQADTSVLKKINGIGPVLALRIVKYREHLGGFVKPEQIQEVYGLDSIVVNRLLSASFLDQNPPTQLNINTASEKELDIHPYINKAIAKALVTYRFQHGRFNSVEEIRNIVLIEKNVAEKLLPYLRIE
jgi:competence protein ComEA